jgi:hypothetical protein
LQRPFADSSDRNTEPTFSASYRLVPKLSILFGSRVGEIALVFGSRFPVYMGDYQRTEVVAGGVTLETDVQGFCAGVKRGTPPKGLGVS